MGRNYYMRDGRKIPEYIPPSERSVYVGGLTGNGGEDQRCATERITEAEEVLGRKIMLEAVKRNKERCHALIDAFFERVNAKPSKPPTQQDKLDTPLAEVFTEGPLDHRIADEFNDIGMITVRQVHLLKDQEVFKLIPTNFGSKLLRRFRKVISEFLGSPNPHDKEPNNVTRYHRPRIRSSRRNSR